MTFSQVSIIYNSLNWNYIEIADEVLFGRYDWGEIDLPVDNERISWSQERYPWAHKRNMQRLFLICTTFTSKEKAIEWMQKNLQNSLANVHIPLVELFCYSERNIPESIDELIDKSEYKDLITFIQVVLDRALLWHEPDFSYPSDFSYILNQGLETDFYYPLKWINNPDIKGVDLNTKHEYIHVFYKYQNLIIGIKKGELYYSLKDLSKQAYLTLLEFASMFFERSYQLTFFNEENWESKFDDIIKRETEWCKAQIHKSSKI